MPDSTTNPAAMRSTYCRLPRRNLSRLVLAEARAMVRALTSNAMPAP